MALLPIAGLTLPCSAASRPVLTSWAYTVENKQLMWSAEDWVVPAAASGSSSGFAEEPWQSHILAVGNATYYAALSAELLKRTGVLLPTLWQWDAWATLGGGASLDTSWEAFIARYRELVTEFPQLPAAPWGVFLGDEPNMLTPDGLNQSKVASLERALTLVRHSFPNATTYANFLYASFACPDASYCCCAGRTGSSALAAALGGMDLDWLSSDEYYDVSTAPYEATYRSNLYPHLRADQRVLLVPFAAYCELGCAKNSTIAPGPADERCAAVARDYLAWAARDGRVAGFAIYRLKNLWRTDVTRDVCHNPDGTGLGLVDVCASGEAAAPKTLALWQSVLSNATAAVPVAPFFEINR